jgi:predicted NAD/FAD-binding protein
MKDKEHKAFENRIYDLKQQIQSLERERDNARADKTRLAAWLKLHYPEAFKRYFLESE